MEEKQIQEQFFIRLKEANIRENKLKFEVLTNCEIEKCYLELKSQDHNIINKLIDSLDNSDFVTIILKSYFSRKKIIDKFKQKFIELIQDLDKYNTLEICKKEIKIELESVDFNDDRKALLTYTVML